MTQITHITRIPCGIVNCYLVVQNDLSFLVDTAYKGDNKRIERSLRAAGVSPSDILLILLTHGHIDHAGSARYFRERYGMPLAMNPLEDSTDRKYRGQGFSNRAIWALTKLTLEKRGPVTPDIYLSDEMSLQEYGFDTKVIWLPGHTAGSMGLLFPDGSLICGDTFSSLIAPRLTYVAEDFASLRHSAQKLQQWQISRVYPGHGKPFDYSQLSDRHQR